MRVKDICNLQNGRAFKQSDWGSEGVPIIRIQNLNNESAPFNYYVGEYDSVHEIDNGELLFSWSGTPGTSFGAFRWYRGKGVLNQHIFKVIPKIEVNKDYLKYALNGNIQTIIAKAHGGVGLQHITKKELEEIDIPIIPLKEQTEIVDRIVQVERIIFMRKQELKKLDNLIKARFVELFGNSEQNPRGLPVLPWNKVFLTTTGKLDSNAMVENGQYPFFTCAKESFWIDTYAFDCEALLLAGNNAAGVYDVKHYKGKFNAYQRTYVLQLVNEQWSYRVFKRQLEDKLRYLKSQSKGTNTRYLTLGILNKLRFVVPPVTEQEQFSMFVAQVDKSKFSVFNTINILFNI